jgi:hypothetical protein
LKALGLRGLGAAGRPRGNAPSLYLLYRRINLIAVIVDRNFKLVRMIAGGIAPVPLRLEAA